MTKARVVTPADAVNAGLDAGNRSMKKGKRLVWDIEDWNAACKEADRLLLLLKTES